MEAGLEKTLVFLVFIGIGVLLKTKFSSPQEVNGIKKIILNLALPATIFIALLGIKVEAQLLLLPVFALLLNFLLFAIAPFLLQWVGIKKDSSSYRTARLLIPSLAPGLSCFPFVLEFLGEDFLAKAAMADLGNKVFVLIILYLVAMQWFYKRNQEKSTNSKAKLMSLLKTLVTEPVNIFIAFALLLLFFGLNMDSLPQVLSDTLGKLSVLMTPLVLLFIGLAVNIKRKQFITIFSLLSLRAAFVFSAIGSVAVFLPFTLSNELLLYLSFGLSACSFWPFAHISVVDSLEHTKEKKTFNTNYAIGILALSFPFSTILILAVLNSGELFYNPIHILLGGGVLFFIGSIAPLMKLLAKRKKGFRLAGPKLELRKAEQIEPL